jgi:L,D-transpeptidase ErfK/SrfK
MRIEKGDSLPDAARHFSLGVSAIAAANPGVDVWVPPAGERVLLPLSFILPDAPRKGIVINLASMRLFRFKDAGAMLQVSTYPVGIGTEEKPTPTGDMRVRRKAVRPIWHVPPSISEDHRKKGDPLPPEILPGPDNPLGECALYLSRSGYLIHGTNKPSSIGLRATNGCIRLYPEDVKKLYEDTPVNTPVFVVNQPYLIGQRSGILYLEVHPPEPRVASRELAKVEAKLKELDKKAQYRLDWGKVWEAEAQAKGVPVPISRPIPGEQSAQAVEIRRPGLWLGSPQAPELRLDAWYVLAADVGNETEARRICAIITHQGPPIPATVLTRSENKGYRVIAGPFLRVCEAEDAIRRLRIDLAIEGIMIEPVRKI